MTPFLQIIHLSDFHFATQDEKFRIGQLRRALQRSRIKKSIQDFILHGLAGHDEFALRRLKRFFDRELSDSPWDALPTWIVNTGDHSTWGSPNAIASAHKLQSELAERPNVQVLDLFGNHDAWPGTFPLCASRHAIRLHRKMLRDQYFPGRHPSNILSASLPETSGKVVISSLNSVIHEKWRNFRAIGEVKEDFYQGEAPRAGTQLRQLEEVVSGWRNELKLLFVAAHHPVQDPEPSAFPIMKLRNAKEVADCVGTATGDAALTIFLAGHTHKLFPAIGQFPMSAECVNQEPLLSNQIQLINGTTMQENRLATNDIPNWPHILTVLRLYQNPNSPHSLSVVRQLAGRHLAQGRYTWLQSFGVNSRLQETLAVPTDKQR